MKVDAEAREIIREAFISPREETLIKAVDRNLVKIERKKPGEITIRRGRRKITFPDPAGVWERLEAYFGWDE